MNQYSMWLDSLKASWEKNDLALLSSILADKLQYFESPSSKPLVTKLDVVNQ